jgi:hypothetical protein
MEKNTNSFLFILYNRNFITLNIVIQTPAKQKRSKPTTTMCWASPNLCHQLANARLVSFDAS